MLFFAQGLVFPLGSPVVLGFVSVACIGLLLVGLFRYARSDNGFGPLLLYTFLTNVLILIAGRALFLVVESLTYDTSADVHAGNVMLAGWAGAVAALIYGILRGVKKRVAAHVLP